MGCMSSVEISDSAVIMQVNKMKIAFESEQNKMEAQAKQKFGQYQTEIKKPVPQRHKDIQKSMLQQIVFLKNKRHIYNVLESDCKKIQDNKHFIGKSEYFKIIIPNVQQILSANSILHDDSISTFKGMLKRKYPQINECQVQQITNEIMKHHKLQQIPSDKMVNDFVLQTCGQNAMSLDLINASGNQFRYGG